MVERDLAKVEAAGSSPVSRSCKAGIRIRVSAFSICENAKGGFSMKKEVIIREALEWGKIIIIAVVIALFCNYFIIINAYVPTGSMESTISAKSRMIGFRLSYLFSEPERGDIIIFKYPDDEKRNFTKRIIGLPGETVEIIQGVVYIDGEELVEEYLNEEPRALDFGPYEVPDDSYFCLGDNRNNSNDARYWTNTYVAKDKILGKAIFSYFPKFKKLN